MASFSYRARRADGSISQGQLEAASRQEALAMLGRQGLQALALDAGRAGAAAATARPGAPRRVSAAALEAFTRQLASLLPAGIPLAQALHLLAHEGSAGRGRVTWQAVHDDVVDGTSLAQAMGNFPEVFPQVYCAMVKAGDTIAADGRGVVVRAGVPFELCVEGLTYVSSSGAIEIAWLLGKDETLSRVRGAVDSLAAAR